MSKFTLVSLVFLPLLFPTPLAEAQDYLNLNAGYFDIMRQKDTAALFGLEYRFDPIKYGIRPVAGGFVTTDDSTYGYAGLDWDIPVWRDQLYLIPNFAIGGYSPGHGKSLGGPVIFRPGIEIDYQFLNAQRLGVVFNHMSNAGLYDHNPSEESALITYSIPIRTIGNWIGSE